MKDRYSVLFFTGHYGRLDSLSELTDPELASDETFRLVIASFPIRRHGAGVSEAEGSHR